MRKKNKILTILLVLGLVFSGFPAATFADEIQTEEKVVVLSENGEGIDVLKELDQPEIIYSLPSETEVAIISEGPTHTYIRFMDNETNEEILGYVENGYLQHQPIIEEETDNGEAEESADNNTEVITEEVPTNEEPVETNEVQTEALTIKKKDQNPSKASESPVEEQVNPTLYGIGLQVPTHVYAKANGDAAVLKTYTQGTQLEYKDYNENWYSAVVYLSGVRTDAFIKKADVDTIVSEQTNETGYANKQLTVYEKASRKSVALKSYSKDSALKFKTYTSDWFEATVYVDGKRKTGYIHKDDVSDAVDLQGIGLAGTVNVYSEATNDSSVLKSYAQGSLLKYKPYNDNYYEATVYINGVRTIGYIAKSDVETIVSEQETLTSYADKQPLIVYAKASRNSASLKSYPKGTSLKFKTYTSDWYEATVYVNGKRKTGYIHKDDVSDSIDLKGIGLAGTVNVYSKSSTTSGVLKSYDQGSLLKYKTYNNSFYVATVYINGVPTTGYIAQNDVETIVSNQETQYEITMSQVPIYSKASTNSGILKSYDPGSKLKFKTLTSDWYEATVFINGKAKRGYIKKSTLKSFKGKVIVIDAGHGGFDPGAIGTRGTREKIINLQTALHVKSLLEAKGAKVVMTRSNDTFLELSERVTVSHNNGADVFISIHYNSAVNNTVRGIETYYWNTNVNEQYLAATVQNEIVKATGLRNRNVRLGNYHVLRENKNPAILVELGYLSNSLEEMTVSSGTYHQKAATGIYNGIVRYFFN